MLVGQYVLFFFVNLVSFKLVQGGLEMHALLHPLQLLPFLLVDTFSVLYFPLACMSQLLSIPFSFRFLTLDYFFLLSLEVLGLLPDDSAPLVELAVLAHWVVSLELLLLHEQRPLYPMGIVFQRVDLFCNKNGEKQLTY